MNEWDRLNDIFGCSYTDDKVPDYAADNIYLAWPSIIRCIDRYHPQKPGLNALDFGCGGGQFCVKLHEMGFRVTGYDQAEELVKSAKRNTPNDVFTTSSPTQISQKEQYHLITAIMVFQFIQNIEATVNTIMPTLAPDGLIIIAVFNPEFIADNANTNPVFSGFTDGNKGYMALKEGVRIPVYNRTEKDYRVLFAKHGWREVYIDYPEFTQEFLSQYPIPLSTTHSEYLIQAFRKSQSPRQ